MKKVVTTITAAIFALGLASAGLAQTTQTPAKSEVQKEGTAVTAPATKPETATEAVKPGETKKEAKTVTKKNKKAAKKGKSEAKPGAPVEKSQPEKK